MHSEAEKRREATVHTYFDVYCRPRRGLPPKIAERLRHHANLSFLVGPHDLVFQWASVDGFRTTLEKIPAALWGKGVSYRIQSTPDDPMFVEPTAEPPSLQAEPQQHPGYPTGP